MELASVIVSILGLSWVIFCFKWLFSRDFRETLKRNVFKNICEETDEYNKYVSEPSKENWQLQNATNQYLGTGKFHYSLIIRNFKKTWDFRDKIRDLNFAWFFIEQKIENENAELLYTRKKSTIEFIKHANILICVIAAISYCSAIIFELVWLETAIKNWSFSKESYDHWRLIVLTFFVIFIPICAYWGSKASVALSLKDTFDIQEKKAVN
ncbi:hypothetical protein [Acinetobacter gerneri]|uniref:hypothetical protein n=1 Tax=Acinetobacter gerneri TaxID=202952 RepID=UPI003A84014A